MKNARLFLAVSFWFVVLGHQLGWSQSLASLVPPNTATHTAIQSGYWFDSTTWDAGSVPGNAAIVYIPDSTTVTYTDTSSSHIFAIRVDGSFHCSQPTAGQKSSLTFDTFVGTHNSSVKFIADGASAGDIEVVISPFDIQAHKRGTSGYVQAWDTNATQHFSDSSLSFLVTREVGPDDRFNSYALALAGNTTVTELTRDTFFDGAGVIGRYDWDSTQLSLGIVLAGEVEILGQEKSNMLKLKTDALRNQDTLEVDQAPVGWKVGDQLIVTSGGNRGASSNGEDTVTIASISGTTIVCTTDLNKNHEGRSQDSLHCYVGNLTRNITFRSAAFDTIHQRGHMMAMHNDDNVQIRNAAFINMGRTDKSRLLDDFIWSHWLEPKVFKSKISALGQEVSAMKRNPKAEITNSRGRYSIHLHKTGAKLGANLVHVTGNVVWGNPGWGISHHDSHADVSRNVIYDVTGGGLISETGSETGFWDDNLIVKIVEGHNGSPYTSALFHDDYLFSGQGLAMKGRAVMCRGNVIANAVQGVGVINMNPTTENHDRIDPLALATVRSGYQFDQFPLSKNGLSAEGDGVMPVEVALIMENTTVINCRQGLRSIERDMGVNHESRSVFDGFKAWGINQGLSITYQADYSFKDVFISGKNANSVGAFLWKHSHNHVFDGIKMVDLGYGITVSKLVESGSGLLKTRNNGFTPWYFIDLETVNVDTFYQIIKEDPQTATVYLEHGDNPIHLDAADFVPRPTTFSILDSSELVVDIAASDLRFEVDGIITDKLGSYDLGIKQAPSQGTLRLDYPQRIYEFDSLSRLEDYLMTNGVFKDTANNDQLYFILDEWLPDRATYEYTSFPVRIRIENAPASGVFANPQIEPVENFAPQNRLSSRWATANQSSTNNSITFDTASIDASAWKAIDGNNNGRVNAQFYQQGLVPVGSFSETLEENEAWFDLDLGELKTIDFIDLWNTVNINGYEIETVGEHFKNFYVLISDTTFGNLGLADARNLADFEYLKDTVPSRKFSLNNLNVPGRYVRVQAVGMNKVALAEVEVIGRTWVDICANVALGTDTQSACDSFTWIDGNTYFASNNTASYTLLNAQGCDSTVVLDLNLTTVNASLTQTGNLLTANSSVGNYQWLDCGNGYAVISGATNQGFTPGQTGSYAVEVSDGVCKDTSVCAAVTIVGLEEGVGLPVLVFPNPSQGSFKVDLGEVTGKVELTLFSEEGRLILRESSVDARELQFDLDVSAGKYFLKVEAEGKKGLYPILVER